MAGADGADLTKRFDRPRRKDANHKAIVVGLRAAGRSVADVSGLAKLGFDLIIGFRGRNTVMEIKDGAKPPSARELTDSEKDMQKNWRGQWCVVHTLEEALAATE